MATLAFSAVGTAVAGPVGGAVGGLIGGQLDRAAFGTPTRQGARLDELAATTSTYGEPIPRHFGRMRVGGAVIWAADLAEHEQVLAGGKSGAALATYSYTASFAVALSSRPIRDLGRIWADGQLLRGAAGDLKVGGTLRIHKGDGDQAADPLIAAAEGSTHAPAHRDLAYVVFEDLDLTPFGNRIPALSFEVIADETFGLAEMLAETVDGAETDLDLAAFAGLSCSGPVAEVLEAIDRVLPLDVAMTARGLRITHGASDVLSLTEPSRLDDEESWSTRSGMSRSRAPRAEQPLALLRYYDTGRDYLPGVQRASGRPGAGSPRGLELPAALSAGTAQRLIEQAARHDDWSRETLLWRTHALDSRLTLGCHVTLPSHPGHWRVRAWEWLASGVELALERVMPAAAGAIAGIGHDPGRIAAPLDAPTPATLLVAFELPLGPDEKDTGQSRPHAALSAMTANWPGAALHAHRGDGQFHALGPSGRTRAIMGTAETALPPATPFVLDRGSGLVVTLVDPQMQLHAATPQELGEGANLALIGEELVQFAQAASLGTGRWRLTGLLRGLGGTESAMTGHTAAEPFVLLETGIRPLDPAILGTAPQRRVLATGLAEEAPATSPVLLDGIALRPLSPVHPRLTGLPDGSWRLEWTRRARGAWHWHDLVDAPLVEEAERYLVTCGPADAPIAAWTTSAPSLELSAADLARLRADAPGSVLGVRQQGTHALSPLLPICTIA